MSNQEEIPWWICKAEDKNFCTYVDTDSNYFHAEPLLRHLYPNFDEMDEGKRDDLLEKMALKYQDLITEYYNTLARDAFNIQEHRLEMKTECTIRSGFFSGKRRYAQYITKKEGIKVEDIDVKGLDFMKSNLVVFPDSVKKETEIRIYRYKALEMAPSSARESSCCLFFVKVAYLQA